MSKEVLGFDANFLKQIKSLMEETDIEELEIEEGEERYLRVSKKKAAQAMAMPAYAAPAAPAQPAHAHVPQQAVHAAAEAPKPAAHAAPTADKYADESKYHKVKSPVIGTYYECPAPDTPPFIKVGDQVSKDTTVCIVEAMKVMNEIKADIKGKVVDILKTSGSPVLSGDALVVIEKN